MSTIYPSGIDNNITLPRAFDQVTPVEAEVVNVLRDTIIAIENELGIEPSREYGTVRARLDALTNFIGDSSGVGLQTVKKDGEVILSPVKSLNFLGTVDVTNAGDCQVDVQVLCDFEVIQETIEVNPVGPTRNEFELTKIPSKSSTVQMFINGSKQEHGVSYVVNGQVVTYTGSFPLDDNDDVEFFYIVTGGLAYQETIPPSFIGDTDFALSYEPANQFAVQMFINGQKQNLGPDYSVTSSNVTYTGSLVLDTSDTVEFWYVASVNICSGGGGGGGDIDGNNVGAGATVFRNRVGDLLNFRRLLGINDIATSVNGDTVEIDGSALLPLSGSRAMVGDLNLGGNDLINVQDGYFGGDVVIDGKLTVAGLIDPTGLLLEAQGVSPAVVGAGQGMFWAEDGTPTVPYFTDSNNVNHRMMLEGEDGYLQYTVGPENSGAQFATITEALAKATADGAGQTSANQALIIIFPGAYLEDNLDINVNLNYVSFFGLNPGSAENIVIDTNLISTIFVNLNINPTGSYDIGFSNLVVQCPVQLNSSTFNGRLFFYNSRASSITRTGVVAPTFHNTRLDISHSVLHGIQGEFFRISLKNSTIRYGGGINVNIRSNFMINGCVFIEDNPVVPSSGINITKVAQGLTRCYFNNNHVEIRDLAVNIDAGAFPQFLTFCNNTFDRRGSAGNVVSFVGDNQITLAGNRVIGSVTKPYYTNSGGTIVTGDFLEDITSTQISNLSSVAGVTVTDALNNLSVSGGLDWSDSLSAGNTTDGYSPRISEGDEIEFETSSSLGFSLIGSDNFSIYYSETPAENGGSLNIIGQSVTGLFAGGDLNFSSGSGDVPGHIRLGIGGSTISDTAVLLNEETISTRQDGYVLAWNDAGYNEYIEPGGSSLKYTVGPVGSGAEFTSIQAAVDQAGIDGLEPYLINILPGVYNEDVTITGSCHLEGNGSAVFGKITIDGYSPAVELWYQFSVNNFTHIQLAITGPEINWIRINNIEVFEPLEIDAPNAQITIFNSTIYVDYAICAGLSFNNCFVQSPVTSFLGDGAFYITANAFELYHSSFNGQINVNQNFVGGSSFFVQSHIRSDGDRSAIIFTSSSTHTMIVSGCTFRNGVNAVPTLPVIVADGPFSLRLIGNFIQNSWAKPYVSLLNGAFITQPGKPLEPITSTDIDNVSTVIGATVTDALNNLASSSGSQTLAEVLAEGNDTNDIPIVGDFILGNSASTFGKIRLENTDAITSSNEAEDGYINLIRTNELDEVIVGNNLVVGGSADQVIIYIDGKDPEDVVLALTTDTINSRVDGYVLSWNDAGYNEYVEMAVDSNQTLAQVLTEGNDTENIPIVGDLILGNSASSFGKVRLEITDAITSSNNDQDGYLSIARTTTLDEIIFGDKLVISQDGSADDEVAFFINGTTAADIVLSLKEETKQSRTHGYVLAWNDDGYNEYIQLSSSGGDQTFAEVLAEGNTTSGNDPVISYNDTLKFATENHEFSMYFANDDLYLDYDNTSASFGGNINISAQSVTGSNAGWVSLQGGDSGTGFAGGIGLYGGNGNTNGGDVDIGGGNATDDGGNVSIFSGDGNNSGQISIFTVGGTLASGVVSIQTGSSDESGDIEITAGFASDLGGTIDIRSGSSDLVPGNIIILAGDSSNDSINTISGGNITIESGIGYHGGDIDIQAGEGQQQNGGNIEITAGLGSVNGGVIVVKSGDGSTLAGNLELRAGNAGGSGAGGNIIIESGSSGGANPGGNINLITGNTTYSVDGTIDFYIGGNLAGDLKASIETNRTNFTYGHDIGIYDGYVRFEPRATVPIHGSNTGTVFAYSDAEVIGQLAIKNSPHNIASIAPVFLNPHEQQLVSDDRIAYARFETPGSTTTRSLNFALGDMLGVDFEASSYASIHGRCEVVIRGRISDNGIYGATIPFVILRNLVTNEYEIHSGTINEYGDGVAATWLSGTPKVVLAINTSEIVVSVSVQQLNTSPEINFMTRVVIMGNV